MDRRPTACFVLLALVLLASPAAADVLVVDFTGGPGSDFVSLPQALDAAQDGDVLLVRPGRYEAWSTVDGRSLTLVADGDGVTLVGTLIVSNLSAGQRVVLRGLTFGYPGSVELYQNTGVVYFEDCTILADQQSGAGEDAGLLAVDSRLVLARSAVAGSMNYAFHETPPTPALKAIRSQVVITDSALDGGVGTDPYAASVPGASGLWLEDATATVHGSSVAGGYGDTASGGTGLVALDGSSVRLLASDVSGGAGSPQGEAQALDGSSTAIVLAGGAHVLMGSSPVREGELLSVSAQGSPGDSIWLAVSLSPGWLPTASGQFVLTLSAPFQLVPLGVVGAGGAISLAASVPALPVDAVDVFLQDLYLDAGSGLKVLGPTTVVTLLDSAF